MIELTTPYDPGDLHQGALYSHARVHFCNMDLHKHRIRVNLSYMYLDAGGNWQIGGAPCLDVTIDGWDFHTAKKLKARAPNGDILREWAKALEQYLIDEGLISGRVIEDVLLDDPPPLLPGQTPHPSLARKQGIRTLGYELAPEEREKKIQRDVEADRAAKAAAAKVKAAAEAEHTAKALRKKAPAPR